MYYSGTEQCSDPYYTRLHATISHLLFGLNFCLKVKLCKQITRKICVTMQKLLITLHNLRQRHKIPTQYVNTEKSSATDSVEFHVHAVAFLSIEFTNKLLLADNLRHCVQYGCG